MPMGHVALLVEAALVPLAMALGWLLDAPAFGTLRWSWRGLAWGIAATAPLVIGLRWLVRTSWPPAARLLHVVRRRLAPIFAGIPAWQVVMISVLAGFGEEALFRGVLQPVAARHLSAPLAVGLIGGVFGVVHWVTPLYALLATIVGIYLGALSLASGTLLAPIAAHALYDVVALAALVRLARAGDGPQ